MPAPEVNTAVSISRESKAVRIKVMSLAVEQAIYRCFGLPIGSRQFFSAEDDGRPGTLRPRGGYRVCENFQAALNWRTDFPVNCRAEATVLVRGIVFWPCKIV